MKMQIKRPQSILGKLIYRPHYLCVTVPDEIWKAKGASPVEEFLDLFDDTRAKAVVAERIKTFQAFAADAHVSGAYASLASLLMNKYWELGSHPVAFARAYYPQILFHLFCPVDRIHEQTVSTIFSPKAICFASILALIKYEIRACCIYSSSGIAGRAKYLSLSSQPLIVELFKGLEYLARLHGLTLDSTGAGKRFKALIRVAAKLNERDSEALWKFRCGIVHAGTLYTSDNNGVWRFGYDWSPREPVIQEDTDPNVDYLRGKHFTVSLSGLVKLFENCIEFVRRDMIQHWEKYALNEHFPQWVQRHLSVQYLPSTEESQPMMRALYPKLSEADLKYRVHHSVAKVYVPAWYIWRLKFPRWKRDVKSRFRSCFR